MQRHKLFCELSPFTYRIAMRRCIIQRYITDRVSGAHFASQKQTQPLPIKVYTHNSLIRRRLGNVDMQLQENKAVNLALAAPRVNGILIRPGETFSFWRLVGPTTARRGYRTGLTIATGRTTSGVGGGMCQFTNLIHWMVLHSPLTITERHHHNGFDLFPDHNRQVPFGVGTSISYNYIDYRVRNDTDITFQLLVHTDDEYLCGELRADTLPPYTYHVAAEGVGFVEEDGVVYRIGEVWRDTIDRATGNHIAREQLEQNHARVMYDTAGLEIVKK